MTIKSYTGQRLYENATTNTYFGCPAWKLTMQETLLKTELTISRMAASPCLTLPNSLLCEFWLDSRMGCYAHKLWHTVHPFCGRGQRPQAQLCWGGRRLVTRWLTFQRDQRFTGLPTSYHELSWYHEPIMSYICLPTSYHELCALVTNHKLATNRCCL